LIVNKIFFKKYHYFTTVFIANQISLMDPPNLTGPRLQPILAYRIIQPWVHTRSLEEYEYSFVQKHNNSIS